MAPRYFELDLDNSVESVEKLCDILNAKGYAIDLIGNTSDFDISASKDGRILTFEVKHDLMALQTGNVAIEICQTDGTPTGLSVTKSMYWAELIGNTFIIYTVERLKELVKELDLKYIQGGDGKRTNMVLIPLDTFIKYKHGSYKVNE
jgi:hypothetical protein